MSVHRIRTKTPFLADFHVHSTFSDGKLTIPQVVDFFGSQGFGAIAITDHIAEASTLIGQASVLLGMVLAEKDFPKYRSLLEQEALRAWDQYQMVVIPGLQLTKNSVSNRRSAHILGVGTPEFIPADDNVFDLCRAIHAQGGVAVAAHPVNTGVFEKQTYELWDQREDLLELIDAWEVASGSLLFEKVQQSALPKIANSDFHIPRHMNSWKTQLRCERKSEAILQAIRRQEVEFVFYKERVCPSI